MSENPVPAAPSAGRRLVLLLTLGLAGSVCVFIFALLLLAAEALQPAAVGYVSLFPGVCASLYTLTAAAFYQRDAMHRFNAVRQRFTPAAVAVAGLVLLVVVMVNGAQPWAGRCVCGLILLWCLNAVFLPLPLLTDRLREHDWKAALPLLWCIAVFVAVMAALYLAGTRELGLDFAAFVLLVALGIFTGYLARIAATCRIEGLPLRQYVTRTVVALWLAAILLTSGLALGWLPYAAEVPPALAKLTENLTAAPGENR